VKFLAHWPSDREGRPKVNELNNVPSISLE
jgi:hypothetical protein